MRAATALDYRELARRRLPRFLFDYLDGGSYGETTLRRNLQDLEQVTLRQRVLRDVSNIDLSVELFGQKSAMPVGLGPVGFSGICARRGEVQAARAAEAAGVPFCLSTMSVCSLDEMSAAVARPIWFQLYMMRDRAIMRDLMAKARDLGCTALVFTVDAPVGAVRYRDIRAGLIGSTGWRPTIKRVWQAMQHPSWAWDVGVSGRPHGLGNIAPALPDKAGLDDIFAWIGANLEPGVSWKDLDIIRSEWKGPLIIKGVLEVEDAREAVKIGADGLVVSNHGGRQLDGAPSTTLALPPIADAVGDDLTLLVDGGVRSGLDVVRMIALGAKGVLLGRAWAYALAAAGEQGVAHMLKLMEAEMRVAMALVGVNRVAAIDRQTLANW
ncbi:L-lactate dehydrogenase [Novosphingobium sp.]|uniref:L-lactate dehydrogenase n=1 Tax=Novosphingobium sp. TaxID=1874826 RepID=UPI002B49320A|nr:L-lactate dehydrogenase [Novosphingobium sp.]HKR93517.1 L-lactate dehydrogenase [Novosphingobium sp.]